MAETVVEPKVEDVTRNSVERCGAQRSGESDELRHDGFSEGLWVL